MPRLFLRLGPAFLAVLLALSVPSKAQQVVISEIMAANDRTLADEDGDFPDWLELYNSCTEPVDLNGWFLTDSSTNLIKWRIPAVTLQPGAFKVVFCSGKNRINPSANLHTSFKLDADGEYCALVRKDGSTVEWEYGPTYPPQQADVSYGVAFSGTATTFIGAAAPAKALVPTGTISTTWTQPSFNDASWKTGVTGIGYERTSGYGPLIGLDVGTMYSATETSYIRVPFGLASVPAVDRLVLRMKYDDGFVAYLNGTRVASANAPATLAWNSGATTGHDDSLAVSFVDYDVTAYKDRLQTGTNVLAVQGLNAGDTSSDFLIVPQLEASVGQGVDLGSIRYFTMPTPGGPNGLAAADQGPSVSGLTHTPSQPTDAEDILVTVRVSPTKAPISSVKMSWRVQYGAVTQVTMQDDGLHGDGEANDGVCGATIPASASTPGQMVRYFVTATDVGNRVSRSPYFANPTASPEYQGTIVVDPSATSNLPVFWWFVQNPSAAGTETGTRASIYYNGEFYDNVFCRLRGLTSSGWPKKSYKFDMNPGFHFRYQAGNERVEEINLNTSYQDKAYVRVPFAWESYAAEGVPGCVCLTWHVRQNSAFYSVAYYVEQPDEAFLTRTGLDPDGALYKMYNVCDNANSGVEKKTRKWEDNSDLQALVTGVALSGSALKTFLYDNVDLPEVLNYLAVTCVVQCTDHFWTNYYLYRDSEGSGEWKILPWDKDLTFGRMWFNDTPLNDNILASYDTTCHPLIGDRYHVLNTSGNQWNRFIDGLYREPTIQQMFVRRLRSVMDDLLQPPGTPAAQLKFETRSQEYLALMSADVAKDRAKWGNPFGASQDFAAALEVLRTQYLVPRRTHLYVTHGAKGTVVPPAQDGNPEIRFGAMEREPASGNQDEEYIELLNPNGVAVDISGWSLSGDVQHSFRNGTVIPANGRLYVSPNVVAFRARSAGPGGGRGLFLQGDYKGHLSALTQLLELRAADGTVMDRIQFELADAASALSFAAGVETPTAENVARLDAVKDGDSAGRVDLADAVYILREVSSR